MPGLLLVPVLCLPKILIQTRPELLSHPVSTVRGIRVTTGLVPENVLPLFLQNPQTVHIQPVPTVRGLITPAGAAIPDITNQEIPVFAQRLVPIR